MAAAHSQFTYYVFALRVPIKFNRLVACLCKKNNWRNFFFLTAARVLRCCHCERTLSSGTALPLVDHFIKLIYPSVSKLIGLLHSWWSVRSLVECEFCTYVLQVLLFFRPASSCTCGSPWRPSAIRLVPESISMTANRGSKPWSTPNSVSLRFPWWCWSDLTNWILIEPTQSTNWIGLWFKFPLFLLVFKLLNNHENVFNQPSRQ